MDKLSQYGIDEDTLPPGLQQATTARKRALYAFFDLEFCSISFDCFNWLLRADKYREECGYGEICVVFVPGSQDGFNTSHLPAWMKRWRLQTIFVVACEIMPNVTGVTLCSSRDEAAAIEAANAGHVFPEGYTVRITDSEANYDRATSAAHESWILGGTSCRFVCGESLPIVRAREGARDYIENWLSLRAQGRKVIVLTLRESGHATWRNGAVDDWIRFAQALDSETYFPVVVRDTDALYRDPDRSFGAAIFEPASLDVEMRMALYEVAYLNLLVNNGPLAICYLNPAIRFIAYRFFGNFDDEGMIPYSEPYGIPARGQLPFATEFQRIVWEEDRFEILSRTFDEMVKRIEAATTKDGRAPIGERPASVPLDKALDVAITQHQCGYLDIALHTYLNLLNKNRNSVDTAAMLGLLMHHRSHPELAAKLLELAVAQKPDNPVFEFNLGVVYRDLGDRGRARQCFERVVSIEPNFAAAWANLGRLEMLAEDVRRAAECYRKATSLGLRDSRTLLEYGSLLRRMRDFEAANQVFADLRENLWRRNRTRFEQIAGSERTMSRLLELSLPETLFPSIDEPTRFVNDVSDERVAV